MLVGSHPCRWSFEQEMVTYKPYFTADVFDQLSLCMQHSNQVMAPKIVVVPSHLPW